MWEKREKSLGMTEIYSDAGRGKNKAREEKDETGGRERKQKAELGRRMSGKGTERKKKNIKGKENKRI